MLPPPGTEHGEPHWISGTIRAVRNRALDISHVQAPQPGDESTQGKDGWDSFQVL